MDAALYAGRTPLMRLAARRREASLGLARFVVAPMLAALVGCGAAGLGLPLVGGASSRHGSPGGGAQSQTGGASKSKTSNAAVGTGGSHAAGDKAGATGKSATTGTPDATATATASSALNLCQSATVANCSVEQEVVALVNAERRAPTKAGFKPQPPLTFTPHMALAARLWSKSQATRGTIGHEGFPLARLSALAQALGLHQAADLGVSLRAENVAMTDIPTTGAVPTPSALAQALYQLWYGSPGHYANMLGDFSSVGVGVSQVGDAWYGTQIFGTETD